MKGVLDKYVKDAVDDQFVTLEEVRAKSKIHTEKTISNKEERADHICFNMDDAVDDELLDFKELVLKELELRLSPEKFKTMMLSKPHLEDQVQELADMLIYEDKVWFAKKTWDRQKLVKWMLAEQAMPCILHMKMRIVETLRDVLFQQATSERYQEGREDSRTKKELIAAIEKWMNENVHGDIAHGHTGQWRFPMKDGKIEKVGMTGNTAKKNMDSLKRLADIVFSRKFDESSTSKTATRRRNSKLCKKWHLMMDEFVKFMALVETKERDLSDAEIDQVHVHGSKFFSEYADMFPEDITNYMHLIGAGHIAHYLRKYRSLHRFSQQGWEALNKLLKSYYHHKTSHGGCKGNRSSEMERGRHMEPLAALVSRRHCWLLKIGQEFFQEMEYCQPITAAPSESDSDDSDEDDIPADVRENPFAVQVHCLRMAACEM